MYDKNVFMQLYFSIFGKWSGAIFVRMYDTVHSIFNVRCQIRQPNYYTCKIKRPWFPIWQIGIVKTSGCCES